MITYTSTNNANKILTYRIYGAHSLLFGVLNC